MGQYYSPIISINGMKTVFDFKESGLKLTEHSYIHNGEVNYIAEQLYHYPARLAWAGDYAEKEELSQMDGKMSEKSETDWSSFSIKNKYILDWTKKEYISMTDYIQRCEEYDEYGTLSPLPLMTAVGNGRGGGDYHSIVNAESVGKWACDVISVEDEPPEEKGWVSLDVWFSESREAELVWESNKREEEKINSFANSIENLEENDRVSVSNYGEIQVTIEAEKESEELGSFNLWVYAPQNPYKPLPQKRLLIAEITDIEKAELRDILKDIKEGTYKVSAEKNIAQAMKEFKYKGAER